jgi:type II secretion system protein J
MRKLLPQKLKAFTLIEVLLATAIGAMVIIAALAAFRSVNQMRQQLHYYSEAMSHGRYALNQIRDDLANFYRDGRAGQMRLVGIKADHENMPVDRLIIYATNDEKIFSGENMNDLYEVEYSLSRDGDKGGYFFSRRYGPVTDTAIGNKAGKLLRMSKSINSLEFEFYDGQTWQRGWDNSNAASMVRVSIKLFDPANAQPPISMSQVISLKPLPKIKAQQKPQEPAVPATPVVPAGQI